MESRVAVTDVGCGERGTNDAIRYGHIKLDSNALNSICMVVCHFMFFCYPTPASSLSFTTHRGS
jgi:hypothetical protein